MEKLEKFQQGKLRGKDLLKVLRHLEDCDFCFESLPPQSSGDLLKRIFKKDEDESKKHNS